ncbi:alpha/beta hydrolase family protein [Roseivirga sp. BDSF3-8]|uniref:alpha/beta hydrolase family protein n=1 Tax=Roseivirga sp. BDSF3-8 TaxID=3241598 RepID=UPI0035321B6D
MSNYSTSPSIVRSGNLSLTGTKHGRAFLYDFRFVPTGQPKPIVIFVHGFKGFKDWGYFNMMADHMATHGLVVAKLNLSHNGTTPDSPVDFADLEAFGQNNFGLELDDLGQLIDTLTDTGSRLPDNEADKSGLHLIGHSRGGSLVLLKAAEDKRVKKVVTWAAVHDLAKRWGSDFLDEWEKKGVQYIPNARTGQEMPLYYQLVEDFKANEPRYSIPHLLPNLEAPLLIVHGTADPSVDVEAAKQLKKWKPTAEMALVEGGDHVFGGGHPWEENELPGPAADVIEKTIAFLTR